MKFTTLAETKVLGGLKIFGILTILGGLFYIMGGALGLGGLFLGTVRIGLVAGPIIMMGGILSSSKARKVRVAGSVLAILGVILAGIYLCGGLVAGLILTLTGSISALRYKEPLLVQKILPSQGLRPIAGEFKGRDH